MKISDSTLDMEMASYSEVLDPSYTNLEFETIQILYNGSGKFEYSHKWKAVLWSRQGRLWNWHFKKVAKLFVINDAVKVCFQRLQNTLFTIYY